MWGRVCVRGCMHISVCMWEREIERKYESVREDERMCVSDSVNCVSVLSERKRLCVNDRAWELVWVGMCVNVYVCVCMFMYVCVCVLERARVCALASDGVWFIRLLLCFASLPVQETLGPRVSVVVRTFAKYTDLCQLPTPPTPPLPRENMKRSRFGCVYHG